MVRKENFQLPMIIVGRSDVMKLRRDLLAAEDYISQIELRGSKASLKHIPRISQGLSDFNDINGVNIMNRDDRNRSLLFINELLKSAPELHISFASDPSSAFLLKIIIWFRNNIDPLILVNIGLEPSIVAGCTLRSANRYYDFSLRHNFAAHRDLLINGLKEPSVNNKV